MDQSMKEVITVLNSVPKENLNYAMTIYDRYSEKFDDGVFENNEELGGKVFILPFIIKSSLGKIGEMINDSYFDKLEEFFINNYTYDFLLKTDLFLQVMSEKTKKHFSIEGGNEVIKVGVYNGLFGMDGSEFDIKVTKTKNEIIMDIINLYLSEYLKKILFIRIFIIYDIIFILESKNYADDLSDEYIFEEINKNLEKTFLVQEEINA